jgi:uncharacterized protein YdhG (YjbR/CyaY superfamily)
MRRDSSSPGAYRRDVSGDQRELLESIRSVIREVAPEIKEGIAPGMLDYPGLANLGAQKHYVALYVAPEVLKEHKPRFASVDAGKSCLRFRRIDQVDASAVRRLLRDVRRHRKTAR